MTQRNGDSWIQTVTGRKFYPLDPRPEEVFIEDIAHSLAMKCRFAGHVLDFYSVAQHSTIMSRIVLREFSLWALLHDAAEGYLADVPRPVKKSLIGFSEIEDRIMRVVAEKFGLCWPMPAEVKTADHVMLATEQRDLMAPPPEVWGGTLFATLLPETITPVNWKEAKARFLARFHELTA